MENSRELSSIFAEIQGMWAMAHRLGNNDFESGAIERIIRDMKDKKITPQEALTLARGIIDSKNER